MALERGEYSRFSNVARTRRERREEIASRSVGNPQRLWCGRFWRSMPATWEVHRYIFTVHALGVEHLDLPDNASNALAGFMIGAKTIATAKITAVYNR